jgi:hypothetical protein
MKITKSVSEVYAFGCNATNRHQYKIVSKKVMRDIRTYLKTKKSGIYVQKKIKLYFTPLKKQKVCVPV